MKEKLRRLLEKVPGSYEDFVLGSIADVDDNEEAMRTLIEYLEEHPKARTDEIIPITYYLSDKESEPPEED